MSIGPTGMSATADAPFGHARLTPTCRSVSLGLADTQAELSTGPSAAAPFACQSGGVAEQQLDGGIANAGRVVRVGLHVLRPSTPHSGSIHAFLRAVRRAGFQGVSS